MSDQSSTSSDSQEQQEGVVKTIYVSVQALSRLRSLSGNFFTPAGFGRIRRENSFDTPSIPERSVSNPTSSITSTSSQSSTSTGTGRFIRTVLILTNNCVYYEAQNWRREVLLEDLIGIYVSPKAPSNKPNACEMEIHYYPVLYSRSGSKQGRKQLVMTVQFDSEASLEDNTKVAKEWKLAILLESQKATRREFCFADDQPLSSSELVERRLLVLINPVGGKRRGVTDFDRIVRPMFDVAEIKYEIVITERQNHGRELIKTYDLSKVDGIVIASGDGLLYEVMNGIMERKDWEKAILTPMGMLPTGSGNAMCASTLHESDEDFGMVNAAFQIIRGGVIPLDLATVQTGEGQKCYMSLIGAWGMISDIDIESEKYRKIGAPRFYISALTCIVKKRLYTGKISYLPFAEDDQTTPSTSDPTGAQQASEDSGSSSPDGPAQALPEGASEPEDSPNGSKVDTPDTEAAVPSSSDDTANEMTVEAEVAAMSETIAKGIKSAESIMTRCPYGPKTDLLPPFSEPIPSSWITIEKEFISLIMLLIPHLSSDAFGDPGQSIGTKKMSIVFLNSEMSRKDLLSTLLNADTGAHIDMEDCTVIHAKAYRLEPATPKGIMTVDGEVIPYGSVQGQVHPGLARIMCRKRRGKEEQ